MAQSARSQSARTSASQRRGGSRRQVRPQRFRRDRAYLAGVLVLMLLVGVMALGPFANYTAAQDRVQALVGQRTSLDQSVEQLQVEADRLEDPAALEEQARAELGMVRPGEIPFIVANPPTIAPAPVNAAPVVKAEDQGTSVVDRFIEWVRSHVR
ncbi:MAG: FtsB family cell division protein [Euzebya sp.]